MTSLVLLAALLGADGAEEPLPRNLSLDVVAAQVGDYHFSLSVGTQLRASIPFGSVNGGSASVGGTTFPIVADPDYTEIFDVGWGLTIEADFMSRPTSAARNPLWTLPPELGGYVAVELDFYSGSEFRDDSGTRVRPQTLRLPQIFAGIKSAGTVRDDFFGDVRVGAGLAHFPSLDAWFRTATGTGVKGEFIEDSWVFALELRFHAGWRWGPGAIVFGLGGRLIAPPGTGANVDLDFGILWTFDFDLGLEIGF